MSYLSFCTDGITDWAITIAFYIPSDLLLTNYPVSWYGLLCGFENIIEEAKKQRNKLRGLSPRANCTDRAAAAGRRS